MEKYARIGEKQEQGQCKKTFVVPIEEYKTIDPKYYFVTTGEATTKVKVLLNDINELAREVRKLQRQLEKTKGDSDYLETAWEDGKLLIKKKVARSKKKKETAK